MKFFVPAAKDDAQATQVLDATRKHLASVLGSSFDSRRVYRLEWTHHGKSHNCAVGQAHPYNGEPVIAILHEPGRRLYHMCTENRGVAREESIFVGENEVTASVDFTP